MSAARAANDGESLFGTKASPHGEFGDKSDEDAVTVVSKRQRKDVVLEKPKKSAVDPPDYETELKLLTKAENPKETFLFQKKHLEAIVSARLKKLDAGSGAVKLLRAASEKVAKKALVVEDLSTNHEELSGRCKTMVKDLKAKKLALPKAKKQHCQTLSKNSGALQMHTRLNLE